jgi:hypothetical protein
VVAVDAELLDIEQPGALVSYLKGIGRVGEDEEPVVRVLAGGVSNRTVLVERPEAGGAWVVKQALPKLRVAVDWFSHPERIHREALGLRWLEALAPPGTITPLVFEDRDNYLLAMEAVPEPHENWKTMLLGLALIHQVPGISSSTTAPYAGVLESSRGLGSFCAWRIFLPVWAHTIGEFGVLAPPSAQPGPALLAEFRSGPRCDA